jgi:hypothetical protein
MLEMSIWVGGGQAHNLEELDRASEKKDRRGQSITPLDAETLTRQLLVFFHE